MEKYLKSARKEVLTLVLVAILISFLVSLLSRIVYGEFYESNEVIFSVLVGVSLLASLAGGLLVITYYLEKSKTEARFQFTINKKDNRFVDIPNCPTSVHARFLFERLDDKKRKYLTSLASMRKFHKSDLSNFVNNTVQEILLNIVLGHVDTYIKMDNIEYRTLDDMPRNIRDNELLSDWDKRDKKVPLPEKSKIKPIDPRESFFVVESPYGYLRFTWGLAVGSSSFHSEPYLKVNDNVSKDNCRDIIANVTLKTKMKYGRILSSRTKEFAEWASAVSNRLDELDWRHARSKFPTVILQNIASKI